MCIWWLIMMSVSTNETTWLTHLTKQSTADSMSVPSRQCEWYSLPTLCSFQSTIPILNDLKNSVPYPRSGLMAWIRFLMGGFIIIWLGVFDMSIKKWGSRHLGQSCWIKLLQIYKFWQPIWSVGLFRIVLGPKTVSE